MKNRAALWPLTHKSQEVEAVMKSSQVVIATFSSSILLFLWSILFWNLAFNPATFIAPIIESHALQNLLEPYQSGRYWLDLSSAHDGLKALLIVNQDPGIRNQYEVLTFAYGCYWALCFFTSLLLVAANVHKLSKGQRFIVVFGLGMVFSIIQMLVQPVWYDLKTSGIQITLLFQLICWLILAISMSFQLGTKKRNIFS